MEKSCENQEKNQKQKEKRVTKGVGNRGGETRKGGGRELRKTEEGKAGPTARETGGAGKVGAKNITTPAAPIGKGDNAHPKNAQTWRQGQR